ncbi:MAG TPA: urease accessory UreF family protein [Verrucomicrobiae bacterium]|jgi:hypothetical protein
MILNGKSARFAAQAPQFERSDAASPQEDVSALLRQIGSPDYFDFSDVSVNGSPATRFLESYVTELLIPVELPAIAKACGHALRQEHRELVLQDKSLALTLGSNPMASASRRIGRFQLTRLRPLRDERVVRRYAESVETGNAEGWHTIVYGISMALFSLPLRQGLLHYARETLETLGKNFGEASVVDSLMERVPPAVEAALTGS